MLVEILVAFLKFLGWTRTTIGKWLNLLISRPLKALWKAVAYRPFLRLYGTYILYLKKLRELGEITNARLAFLRKFIAPLGVLITVVITILTQIQKLPSDNANAMSQAVMASLVRSEFDYAAKEELITESVDDNWYPEPAAKHYLDEVVVLKPVMNALTNINPPEEKSESRRLVRNGNTMLKPLFASIRNYDQQDIVSSPADTSQPTKAGKTVIYTVKAGDSISRIAKAFGISVNTILWENNLTERSLIRQGQELAILQDDGISYKIVSGDTLQKIAKKFKVEADKIANSNNLEAGRLVIGQKIFIPDGRRQTTVATSYDSGSSKGYNGVSAIKDIIKPDNAKPAAGAKMNWPTVGYRITQYYSWRHTGLDIGNKVGTPLYAADSGVVEKSGWNSGGYGYMVLVNHGGGVKTRYAHASKLYVKVGERVEKGQTLAAMGSTGRSTGPHIHFEVIINGKLVNPLNYIK